MVLVVVVLPLLVATVDVFAESYADVELFELLVFPLFSATAVLLLVVLLVVSALPVPRRLIPLLFAMLWFCSSALVVVLVVLVGLLLLPLMASPQIRIALPLARPWDWMLESRAG